MSIYSIIDEDGEIIDSFYEYEDAETTLAYLILVEGVKVRMEINHNLHAIKNKYFCLDGLQQIIRQQRTIH